MPLPAPLSDFIALSKAEISGANILSAGRLMGNVNSHVLSIRSYIEPTLETMQGAEAALNAVSAFQQELAVSLMSKPETVDELRQAALDELAKFERILQGAKLNEKARHLGF